MKGAGLKYTSEDGVPDWAVGKTADEILEISQTLYQTMVEGDGSQGAQTSPNPQSNPSQTYGQPSQSAGAGGQPTVSAQHSPSPTQPNQNVNQPNAQSPQNGQPSPPDPDLIYSDKAEYQRQLEAWQRAQTQSAVQQASAPILKPLARMAREQSKSDPKFSDVWKRYGPEIEATIRQNVPEQNRTDPEIWNQAAKMVAGEHWEELAQDRAETVAAQPADSGTVPGGGVTDAGNQGGAQLDEISKLFRNDHPSVSKFKALGKDADDIRRHAASMGHSPDEYAEILKRKASVRYTANGTPTKESEAAHLTAVPPANQV